MATRNYVKSATLQVNANQLAAQLDTALSFTGTEVTVGITPTLVVVTHPSLTSANDAAVNATIAAYIFDPLYDQRGQGVKYVGTASDYLNLNLRAAASVLCDEINALRSWLTDFKAQVALASSLANLQTRVAALPAMPARTLSQAVTAIQNKINTGGAD